MSSRKKRSPAERDAEIQAARLFGKQVSEEKGRLLLAATLAACALPVLLGLRLWDRIPETVPSGLIGADGEDDSLPRWAVVFGLPGLMCLLNFIAHMQLRSSQKRQVMPPPVIRLVGRWGMPVISVLFCSGMMMQSAGFEDPLPPAFLIPALLGSGLLLLGSHMLDCPRDSRLTLPLRSAESDAAWNAAHTFAGRLWLAGGLVVIAGGLWVCERSATAALPLAALAALLVLVCFRSRG